MLNLTCNLSKMKTISYLITKKIVNNDVIFLHGDLGSGKTTFTNFFINNIAKKKTQVNSPSFNILKIYEFEKIVIKHFDFYRLQSFSEIQNINFSYKCSKKIISIIEWGEIYKINYKKYHEIYINFCANKDLRNINISNNLL